MTFTKPAELRAVAKLLAKADPPAPGIVTVTGDPHTPLLANVSLIVNVLDCANVVVDTSNVIVVLPV